jgi:hypothetical protein
MFSFLLFVAAAEAGEFKSAGSAAVSSEAELPLFAGIDPEDPYWYVEAKIGETPLLLRIATEAEGLGLTEAAAARAGLKPTGKEGQQTAAVASLQLGTVTVTRIKANVAALSDLAYGVDGRIGIAAFPDLAWAIEPAKGTVKIGPSGPNSVADSVGAGVAFSQARASSAPARKNSRWARWRSGSRGAFRAWRCR